MTESQKDYAKSFNTGSKGTHPLIFIIQLIIVVVILVIVFNYATAVDEKYVDEDGICIKIIEVPMWGEPIVHDDCETYSPSGRSEVIVVKNR